MGLAYQFPELPISIDFINKRTGHKAGKWMWRIQALPLLMELDCSVVLVELFDYSCFAEQGDSYLEWLWSPEVAALQRDVSDMTIVRSIARQLPLFPMLKNINSPATTEGIHRLNRQGFLLIPMVNPSVFDHVEGYTNHSVAVTHVGEDIVHFHDPGLPPIENHQVPMHIFYSAMCSPNARCASLFGFKRNA